MNKTCKECNEEKILSELNFHKHKASKDGFNNKCIICRRKRNLINYHKNQKNWRETHTKTRLEKKEKIQEIKKSKLCLKCGEKRHYLLDFHHLDPTQKDFQISQGEGKGWNKILEEIAKCVCICSNCHREFHYFERESKITIEDYLEKAK